jgi:hypothetical protein
MVHNYLSLPGGKGRGMPAKWPRGSVINSACDGSDFEARFKFRAQACLEARFRRAPRPSGATVGSCRASQRRSSASRRLRCRDQPSGPTGRSPRQKRSLRNMGQILPARPI